MCVICQTAYGATGAVLALNVAGAPVDNRAATLSPKQQQTVEQIVELQSVPKTLKTIKPPKLTQPDWYKKQIAAEQAAARVAAQPVSNPQSISRVFTYTIKTDGTTRSNLSEFSTQTAETLSDTRGWSQLGIKFKQVSSGGDFHLILAEASRVPSYSPGCSADWSCRVGVSVIINDDRWAGATTAWNNAGGSLRDYRHMVINHEIGHWLGHGHINCSAPGAYAPIMQQQSIDLQGCKFNPWPLPSELWTSR